jgi:hypothetical protein
MTITIHDPIFGRLTKKIHWEGSAYIAAFAKDVPLTISSLPNQRPAEYQRQIFQELAADPKLISKLKDAVYAAYEDRCRRGNVARRFDRTSVTSAEDAWNLLDGLRLSIPWQHEPHRKCISVIWTTPWLHDEALLVSYWERGELTFSLDNATFDRMVATGTSFR